MPPGDPGDHAPWPKESVVSATVLLLNSYQTIKWPAFLRCTRTTDFAVVWSLGEAVDGKGVTNQDILRISKELGHC